jgi:hypothetical protein
VERVVDQVHPKALKAGPLTILNRTAPSFVLEDRRRIIASSGLLKLIGLSRGSTYDNGCVELPHFLRGLSGSRLQTHVSQELRDVLNGPIDFVPPHGGRLAHGYEATVLVDLCNAINEAHEAGDLHPKQKPIAEHCDRLVHAIAKTGIIALVDEATGYQEERPAGDLQQAVTRFYVQDLPNEWKKQFDDEFYVPLGKILGLNPHSNNGAPSHRRWGQVTNELIYCRLGPGVLEKLKALVPSGKNRHRDNKFHQFLTQDVGIVKFTEVMTLVKGLLKCHTAYRPLVAQLDQMRGRYECEDAARIVAETMRERLERERRDHPLFPESFYYN